MRIMLLTAAAAVPVLLTVSTAPATAQQGPPTCERQTPPSDPNSEDGNPGLGGAIGLNQDFHDDGTPPGRVIGPANREAAHSGEPGGNHLLQDAVGNDCPKAAEG